MGLKILGDFNFSFFPLVGADVAIVTLVRLFPGWKNGFATGEPNTKAADLLRLVTVGLKVTSAGLPKLFLVASVDCKKATKEQEFPKSSHLKSFIVNLLSESCTKNLCANSNKN